jgi:hypothetical protein
MILNEKSYKYKTKGVGNVIHEYSEPVRQPSKSQFAIQHIDKNRLIGTIYSSSKTRLRGCRTDYSAFAN